MVARSMRGLLLHCSQCYIPTAKRYDGKLCIAKKHCQNHVLDHYLAGIHRSHNEIDPGVKKAAVDAAHAKIIAPGIIIAEDAI